MKEISNKKLLMGIVILFAVIIVLSIWALIPSKTILQGEADATTINVSSKIAGRVSKIFVKKGDFVQQGEILAEIETPELEAKFEQIDASLSAAKALNQKAENGARIEEIKMAESQMLQAKSAYELAQKTNERMQNLFKEGVISAQKSDEANTIASTSEKAYKMALSAYQMAVNGARYEDKNAAQANVQKAEAALKEINSYLSENKIIAPHSGEITQISAENGELISTGYPIFVINDNDDVWFTFNVKETLLPNFKQGSTVNVEIPALNLKNVLTKVSFVAVRGSYATYKATRAKGDYDIKTFEVRLTPVDKDLGIKAGMTALIEL